MLTPTCSYTDLGLSLHLGLLFRLLHLLYYAALQSSQLMASATPQAQAPSSPNGYFPSPALSCPSHPLELLIQPSFQRSQTATPWWPSSWSPASRPSLPKALDSLQGRHPLLAALDLAVHDLPQPHGALGLSLGLQIASAI
ncbi:hypothetical protein GOP47_0002195, partial [Adiantum capillus-veneris]